MHEVLVNRLGGLSLPRKSVVRLTDLRCLPWTLNNNTIQYNSNQWPWLLTNVTAFYNVEIGLVIYIHLA